MTNTIAPLTSAELADLKAKAKAATPGKWRHYRNRLRPNLGGIINEVQCDEETPVVRWNGFDDADRKERQHARNASYIAAANPETILRLIDMIERRDEQIEKLRGALSKCARKLERCICAGGSDAEFAAIAISEFTAALAATEPQP